MTLVCRLGERIRQDPKQPWNFHHETDDTICLHSAANVGYIPPYPDLQPSLTVRRSKQSGHEPVTNEQ